MVNQNLKPSLQNNKTTIQNITPNKTTVQNITPNKNFYSNTFSPNVPKTVSNSKLIIDYLIISCIIILQVLFTSSILNLFFTKLNIRDSHNVIVLKIIVEIFLIMLFVYLTVNILTKLINKFGNNNMIYIMKMSPILNPVVTIMLVLSFTYILKDKLFSKLRFIFFSLRNNLVYNIPELKNLDVVFQNRLKKSVTVSTEKQNENKSNTKYQIVNRSNNKIVSNNRSTVSNIMNNINTISEEDNDSTLDSSIEYINNGDNLNNIYSDKHSVIEPPNIYNNIYGSEKYYQKNSEDLLLNNNIRSGESRYVE